jgi:hypothetical protein
MVSPSTRRALNTRALNTAEWLRRRAKRLQEKIGYDVSAETIQIPKKTYAALASRV